MFLPGEQAEESRSAGAGNGRFDLPAVLEDGASAGAAAAKKAGFAAEPGSYAVERSEEHTSELQSLMRISYAVFCLKITRTFHRCTHTRSGVATTISQQPTNINQS